MLTRHAALEAAAFAIAVSTFSCVVHADQPARRWRPATEADLPAGTLVLPGNDSPGTAAPSTAAGVRIHIDPATGAIVPAPADSASEAAAGAAIDAAAPPLVLKKSPSGLLYVDTSEYRHTATVTLDAHSQAKLDCEDPPQDAAAAARLAGQTAVAAQQSAIPVAESHRHARTEDAAARTAAQQQRLARRIGAAAATHAAATPADAAAPSTAAEQ